MTLTTPLWRPPDDSLYSGIRDLLVDARGHVAQTVNTAMVRTCWYIGELIDDHLRANSRSELYGTDLLGRLDAEFGRICATCSGSMKRSHSRRAASRLFGRPHPRRRVALLDAVSTPDRSPGRLRPVARRSGERTPETVLTEDWKVTADELRDTRVVFQDDADYLVKVLQGVLGDD